MGKNIGMRVADIVSREWGLIGWGSFVGLVLVSGLVVSGLASHSESSAASVTALLFAVLWIIWWGADIIWQRIPLWTVAVGAGMLGIGVFFRAPILVIACWIIYCLRVRE